MPWNNNSGGQSPWGNPRPQGPWGQPPSGGGGGGGGQGGRGPDLDDAIRQAQDAIRKVLPSGGSGGGKLFALIGVVLTLGWAASGFYRVQPDEQGVVMRFGAFSHTTQPGLNYRLPCATCWPNRSC